MHHRIFIFAFVAMNLAGRAGATGTEAVDRQISEALKDLNNRGADLNNAGDAVGCYRMYQGGLVVLKPLLVHRPAEQKTLNDALRTAEAKPAHERAKTLHTAIAAVYSQLKPAPTTLHAPKTVSVEPTNAPKLATPPAKPTLDAPGLNGPPAKPTLDAPGLNGPPAKPTLDAPGLNGPPAKPTLDAPGLNGPPASKPANEAPALNPPPASFPEPSATPPPLPLPVAPSPVGAAPVTSPTLWDRLGGNVKTVKIVDDWLTISLADKNVNLSHDGKYKLEGETLASIKSRLVGFVSSVSDGPVPFSVKSLKDVHECMSMSAGEFDALVSNLKKAATAQGAVEADVQALAAKVNAAKKDIVADAPK